jgi:Tfp pilus assembly protein PilO
VKLTLRERRILFAGIAVAAAILVFYALISWLPDQARLSQQVDTAKNILLKQREILSLEETYRKKAEQGERYQKQVMTRLLPGDNFNVASAELQKVVKDFADQNGVDIILKTTLPEKKVADSEFLTKVSLRIEVNCGLEQLVNFLTAIENYDKFLKVEELIITGYKLPRRSEIRPNLTITGYIHSPEIKPAETSAQAAIGNKTVPSMGKNQAVK